MTPRARKIISEVCSERGVPAADVLSWSRKRPLVYARAVIAQRLDGCGYSLTQIGWFLNKDHTAILFYLGRAKRRLDMRPKWRAPKVRHVRFIKPPKPVVPKPLYLVPYAGADFHGLSEPMYRWKERPGREVAA